MFEFGKNWERFSLNAMSEETLDDAAASVRELLGGDRLKGAAFVDVGCGSGLFSIAAARLGAARVMGLDVDPKCIEVAKANAARFGFEKQTEFKEISILDRPAAEPLGTFDVVYAWGSLHHTGDMRTAISNAAALVGPGGAFALAIYNRHSTSRAWERIKKTYNHSPGLVRAIMIYAFCGIIYAAKLAVTRRNPLEQQRGMNFFYNVVDWVGGWPYEYASIAELCAMVEPLGFETVKTVPAQVPTGCNEFVFRRV